MLSIAHDEQAQVTATPKGGARDHLNLRRISNVCENHLALSAGRIEVAIALIPSRVATDWPKILDTPRV